MRAFASVTKEIAGPLSAATKSFGQLSMEVQGAFNPALKQAQVLSERLADTINKTGTVSEERFKRIAGAVNVAVDSMSRLSEASKLVGGLATGKELRFSNPQFVAEATRSQRLQQEAAALSPSSISSGGFAGLVSQISSAAAEAERLNAALENETQLINGDVPAATAKLTAQLAVWRSLNEELERRNEAARKATVTSSGQKVLENETAALVYRARAEKELEASRIAAAQKAADSETAALVHRARAEKELEASRIAAAQKVADSETAALIHRQRAEKEAESRRAEAESRRAAAFLPLGDLRKAAAEAKKVEDAIRGAAAVENFGTPFSKVFETAQIDSYKAKLRILQEILIGAGVSAGTAADEVNNLADALQNAASKEGGLKAGAAGIAMQQEVAVAAVAAAVPGAGGVKGINRRLDRAGDVGRGGMDKASLALNQLAFAVDDFMSSTGGIEHKLRAVSNNITQLGFVAGGTTGLFVALGAVVAGQAAVALVKWANSGIDAEQQTKALNDALTKQKSLVEELAQAFESLGDSIAKTAYSEAGGRARQFREELSEIAKKQKELRESRLFDVDPAVQAGRAKKNQLNKRLEGATDIGQRVAIAGELLEVERQTKAAMAAISARGAPNTNAILERALYGISSNEFGGSASHRRESAESRQAALRAEFNAAGNSPTSMIRVLEQRRAERQAVASQDIGVGSLFETGSKNIAEIYRARDDVAQLTRDIESLRAPLEQQFQETLNSIAELAFSAAEVLSQAQHEAAEAIKAGIPGARSLQSQLDGLANELDKAVDSLKAAQQMEPDTAIDARIKEAKGQLVPHETLMAASNAAAKAAKAAGVDLSRNEYHQQDIAALREAGLHKEAEALQAALDWAKAAGMTQGGPKLDAALAELKAAEEAKKNGRDAKVAEAQKRVDEVRAKQDASLVKADALRRQRTVDPQRQAEAVAERAKNNLSEAGLGSGILARRLREIEFERETINQQAQRYTDPMSASVFEKADAALAEETRQIEAATIALKMFSNAVQQASQELKSNVSSAEQASQDARRKDLARSTVETRQASALADKDQRRARRMARDAQDAIDNETARQEEAARNGPNAAAFRRIREINEQLESGSLSAAEQRALRAERARLQDQVQPEVDANERRMREITAQSTREEERRKSAERGRELAKTPAQKAAEQAAEGLSDIREFFATKVEEGGFLMPQDMAARNAAASRFGREQLEQAAPAIASMAEEVQNAILQGPSRAALEVSDVSTVQGQKELNRLLRGDDSAKNANIVELEKQNQKLVEVVAVLKDIARNAGIVLDL
jgi:hypothetical protein